MKKLKAIVLVTTIFTIINPSFSQTNIIPINGDVGIGTLTPSAKLDVNGSLMVDSMATFKDSLRVQKKLIVDQDVKIQGKSVFIDDGKFKADLKVLGVGRMKDKLVVEGLTRLNGDLKLMSLPTTTAPSLFLSVNQYGKVGSLDKTGLLNVIYQPLKTCFTDINGNISALWKQNPNPNFGILYTGVDCPARVGIGTSQPQTSLDVNGKISMRNGATAGYIPVSDANGVMTWTNPSLIINQGLWQANGASIFFNTGKVGVGTNNPTVNLDIIGTGRFTSNVGIGTPINPSVQLLVKPSNATNIGLCIETPNIGNYNYGIKSIMSNPNAKAFAVVDNQDNFIVWGDGRVNIITEASQNVKSFSVIDKSSNDDVFRVMSNGNVYATKVLVRTTPFPDYVFNSDYQLMSLMELETYIKTNKHLPNMPTAEEVTENGADLGEINRVLVEKTEELTLYIIALKKELETLKTEVTNLK